MGDSNLYGERDDEDKHLQPITWRVQQMRDQVVHSKPILCSERANLVTEAYRETESMPYVMRRALAFKKIMENMTQNIFDGELIVGSHGSNGRRSAPVFPEFSTMWLEAELDGILETREQDPFVVPEQVKIDLKNIFPYWRNQTVHDKYRAMLPEETKTLRDAFVFTRGLFEQNGYGHTAYDVPKLLKVGLAGLKEEVQEQLVDLDLTTSRGLEQKQFYEALLIGFDAVITYARRYADKALTLARSEPNSERKQELEKIADVCCWVPEYPARDMWDAVQVVAFMQLIIQTETNGDSVSPGRLDQYFHPYYQSDIANGRYTVGQIQELLDCLWIKFNEIIKVQDNDSVRVHPGFPMTPNVTIGGQTSEGKDATNALSYLMLNCQEHIRLTNPQFTVRFHENSPQAFKLRVLEVVKLGTGMPAMFSDEACMEALSYGLPQIPEERIRDYRIVGCVELAPRGFQGRVNGGWLNVARVVDFALNNGVDRLTGKQLGPQTGVPKELTDYDALLKALRRQVAYVVEQQVINAGVVDMVQRQHTPHLFLSSLVEGCIEHGKDITEGGSLWGLTPIMIVGLATAADSLTAVKKLVIDEQRLSMSELKEALDSNFDGEKGEEIREAMRSAPKYGNDDDEADGMMQDLTSILFEEIERHRDIDQRPYTSTILSLGSTVPHGWKTGATADGRKATTPVSDSMSASSGTDQEGPTAMLLSASKIDQRRCVEGNVVNLKFNPMLMEKEENLEKLEKTLSAYFHDLAGQEVQINVVSADVLRNAQKKPEEYQDLIIRVAGYSARFVELARELQNDIIRRTEYQRL